MTHHTGLRIAELGFLINAIGGAVLALTALAADGVRSARFLGGAALAVGSVLLIIAFHWGHF
jgi:hypothetical protein